MIPLWIPLTIAAAFLQNLRSAMQRHLQGRLSTAGATFVRFGYGFPFALLYLAGLVEFVGLPLPDPGADFALFAVLGGVAQIVGTWALLRAISLRNFAVGTAYSKTETVQTALFGLIILGDHLSLGAVLGILVSLVGVLAISVAKSAIKIEALFLSVTDRAALLGLASGACYGIAAVSYRAASLSLGGEGFLVQAAFTLACVTVLQTALMLAYFAMFDRREILEVCRAWRVAIWVGLAGVAASAGWFTAMTIQNAAYVRALGQIELVFTFIASRRVFGEHSSRLEIAGVLLIVAGILCLLLLG